MRGAPVADHGDFRSGDLDLLDGQRAVRADELLVAPTLDLLAAGEDTTPVVDRTALGERVEEGGLLVAVDGVEERTDGLGNGLVWHGRSPCSVVRVFSGLRRGCA